MIDNIISILVASIVTYCTYSSIKFFGGSGDAALVCGYMCLFRMGLSWDKDQILKELQK